VNSTQTACPQCGRPLSQEPKFCPSCGRRLSDWVARAGRLEGYAVASIICAVAGLFALPVVGPILGIVFGKKALRNIDNDPSLEGAGLAQAGVIVGWVGLLVSLVVMAGVLVVFAPVFTSSNY
jgi:uncharacterized protein DUF4190/zinc ribbon protein